MASASVRSSLPLRKARRVNSPGSAIRKPGRAPKTSNTAAMTARLPMKLQLDSVLASRPAWRRHKIKRDAVVDLSPLCGSRNRTRCAWRGSGTAPARSRSAAVASGPETRTTAGTGAAGRRREREDRIAHRAETAIASRSARADRHPEFRPHEDRLRQRPDHGHDPAPDRAHINDVLPAKLFPVDRLGDLSGLCGQTLRQVHARGHPRINEAGQDGDDLNAAHRQPRT